jgi:hypothetical protein
VLSGLNAIWLRSIRRTKTTEPIDKSKTSPVAP